MIGLRVIAPFVFIATCLAQDRFPSGELEGSPIEHIINRVDRTLRVRSLSGVIQIERVGDPVKGALVEIRGPGDSKAIMAAITDARGRFHFRHVPEGAYGFKVTLDAFQSLTGNLVVDRHAKNVAPILLQLRVGV